MALTPEQEAKLAAAKKRAALRAEFKRTPSGAPLMEEPGWFEPGSVSGKLADAASAATKGAAEAATFGFSDELAGLAAAAGEAAAQGYGALAGETPEETAERVYRFTGKTPGSERSAYQVGRDIQRGIQEQAAAEFPKSYMAGQLSGALLTAPLMPGAAARGATIGARLTQLGKVGIASGAATGLGTSQADLTEGELGKAAADVAQGAAFGAAAAPVGVAMEVGPARLAQLTGADRLPFIGKAMPQKTFAEWLRGKGIERMVRSVTPQAGLVNRLRKAGYVTEPELTRLGERIAQTGIVQPFETAGKTLARAEEALAGSGENIGAMLSQAQKAVETGRATSSGFERLPSRDVQRELVRQELDRLAEQTGPQKKAAEGAWSQLRDVLITDQPAPGEAARRAATFPELWKTKSQLQEAVNWRDVAPLQARMHRKAVQEYRRGVLAQVEQALGPESREALEKEAFTYGTLSDVEELLRERASREAAKQSVGLGDLGKAQLVQGAMESPVMKALAVPGAWALGAWRRVSDPTMAVGYMEASKLAQQAAGGPLAAGAIQTVAGPAAIEARRRGYDALREYLGITPESPEQASDIAYSEMQTNPALQPGRR